MIAQELGIDERPSVTARTSRSASALREFLKGSAALREGSLVEAIDNLQEATTTDPEFGLAWSRLARAGQLQGEFAVVDRALERASEKLDRMPPKSRTLTRARDLAFRAGRPEDARRLYASILTTDSTNVEALSEIGETIVRYNPRRGLRLDEAESYFRQALTYSPSQTPILERLYGIAIDSDRRAEADSILAVLNRRGEGGTMSSFVRLATGLEDIDAAEDLLVAADESGRMEHFIPGTTRFLQSLLAAAEGRFEDHERLTWEAGPEYAGARLVSEVMLRAHTWYPASGQKLDELATRIAQWDTAESPVRMLYEDDVFAGDYRSVRAFLAGVIALKASNTDDYNAALIQLADIASESGKDLASSLASTLEALDAEMQGDNERALERLDEAVVAIPWLKATQSELYDQSLNRYLRSEILFKLGRYEESLEYSKSLTISGDIWGLTYLGPLYLRRAETYTRLGQDDRAVDQYRRLFDLWKDCDPGLVEKRQAARVEMLKLLQSDED
jgi:tetratricopeptide (TPR) repeat protein